MDERPPRRPCGVGDALLRVDWIVEAMTLSGGVRVVVELAEGLAARGHEVRIVTKDAGDGWIVPSVPVLVVPAFTRESLPEGDVAVATWFPTVVPALRAGRHRRVLHFCQGYEGLHSFLAHRLGEIEEAYAAPVARLAVSPHLVELLEPRFGGTWHVLPPSLRAEAFVPPARTAPAGVPTLGLAGPFEWAAKGVAVGLAAVEALARGGRAARLHRLSPLPLSNAERRLREPDRYDVALPAAAMPAWYHALDLLLFPSYPEGEGLGLPPLEAMAAGVPVVMTDIPSLRFVPLSAASKVPPGDAGAIAAEAARLLDDPALWLARRAEGLRFAATLAPARALDRLEEALAS